LAFDATMMLVFVQSAHTFGATSALIGIALIGIPDASRTSREVRVGPGRDVPKVDLG
jgi:hypothetical protein